MGSRYPSAPFRSGAAGSKLQELMRYIDQSYVDRVDADSLLGATIDQMLQQLDPHSSYIEAEYFSQVEENLHGSFYGIGVEFNIIQDTVVVISAITGGPSEQLGIQGGDRIVIVERDTIAGVGIENAEVIHRLRGERGTEVQVQILRPGTPDLLSYKIIRDEIPLQSLDAAYLLNDSVGYIKLNRFAETTMDEYRDRFEQLSSESTGLRGLILDLRGNPGGFLHIATQLADEFLAEGLDIVHTEGRMRAERDNLATRKGAWEQGGLAILIDAGSASASEIVAGAVQDHDRGWIVGERSFGKGLVQEQMPLSDGSAVRLTVARYYTPSGRCIQRPYHSEIMSDSARVDTFYTSLGRPVFDGGGILPDIHVAPDSVLYDRWYYYLMNHGDLRNFAFHQADSIRIQGRGWADFENTPTQQWLMNFQKHVVALGFSWPQDLQPAVAEVIGHQLKAMIARQLDGNESFYQILNQKDPAIDSAMRMLFQPIKAPEAVTN